jgi:acyl transferase domain-containing protein/thioesterase domain-containing protein/acyl carrier protein
MTDINANDVAIVGMAIRLPGARTPEQFWENLVAGREAVQRHSDEQLVARGVAASTLADPLYVKAGIQLENVADFDPEFFGFSPKEGAILDPQHRHFYEAAWEALERSGHPPARFAGAIGVFAGCGMGAYFTFNLLTNPALVDSVGLFLLRHTGNDKDFLATRVSYAFDLKGPSVNVQTACSTSLVATHLAVQSLLAGECDMALAGGVTIEIPHGVGYHFRQGEVLSPDGHCRPFDHRSQGTVFGSGVGVIALRRLADAIADGDHIHAVIKGSAVNNDGSGKVGYLAPSVDGQAAAMIEALAVADVSADTVTYVECHGTATPVGDPIEVAALTRAFRETSERIGYCKLGSVKSNIGHLDTAAGVAGLIKAALALEHRRIPPSLNFEAPNPNIAFDGSPFVVADELTEWEPPPGVPRRAGVNSLGVGGTNAFVVLEEPPRLPPSEPDAAPQPLVLSARTRKALEEASVRLAAWLRGNTHQRLADIAFSLYAGRAAFEHRRVLAATTHVEAASLLEQGDLRRVYTHTDAVDRPSVVFMYPGGGAQHFRMGRGLYERERVFREHMDGGLSLLHSKFGVDLRPLFLAEEPERERVSAVLSQPSSQLPLTFLIEYALTRLWEHYGVTPSAVIGHSMGENTAACIAGVIDFEDALGLLLLRGQLVELSPPGAMLSVPMAAEELAAIAGPEIDIAAANSRQLTVASGPAELLDGLAMKLLALGVESQRVKVSVAAHSRLLDGVLGRFRDYLRSIELHPPRIPVISNRTGAWLSTEEACDPEYWVGHLRNTVRFGDGIATLLESEDRVFLEVGPGNMLGSFTRQNPNAPAYRVFSSMRHPEDPVADDVYLRTIMGRLWAAGIQIDPDVLWPTRRRRVPLPTYPFQHAPYWIEPGRAVAVPAAASRPMRLADFDDWFRVPRWVQQGILEFSSGPRTWLVFQQREPVADALIERLRADGNRVITVQDGDTFAELGPDEFTLAPEAGGDGYQELIDHLVGTGAAPDAVLHTWLLTWDRRFRPGSSFLHRNQNAGFYSLFYLARALGRARVLERPLHLLVAANGIHRIAAEPVPHPDKSTVIGACTVIPREHPNVTCTLVDLELPLEQGSRRRRPESRPSGLQEVIEALTSETLAAPATAQVAWRAGVRWQRHIGPYRARQPDVAVSRVRHGGVYLITGGLGGIGGALAEWLASEYRAKLVLVGRTPLPQRDGWDQWLAQQPAGDAISGMIGQVRRLEELGAEVLVRAADVAVADALGAAVDEAYARFGAIHGVFHAAGVVRDSLIQLKSAREIEDVFSAKLYGTLVLDDLFRESALEFMVLFSSSSVFVAPQGQIDYVGSNAFLNAFASACSGARPYPVTAVNWGIWKDVGIMAAPQSSPALGADDDIEAHATTCETAYPLFNVRHAAREGRGEVQLFSGTLSAEHDWVVAEHRLGSNDALLPGTGYLEIVRAGLMEIGHGLPWKIDNLLFERPLFVRDGQPRRFKLRLRGEDDHWQMEILAAELDAAAGQSRWETCASGRVCRLDGLPDRAIDLPGIEARCTQVVGGTAGGTASLRTRQEDHLRFGPRWRVLKRLATGAGEALARLRLPPAYESDLEHFALHPALIDMATGCALDLIPGYAQQEVARDLWVPISYRSFRHYRILTPDVVSWLRLDAARSSADIAMFDVTVAAPDGSVLAEVEGLTLRRLSGAMQGPEPTRQPDAAEAAVRARRLSPGEQALVHNVTQGITTREGVSALTRLLTTVMPAEVIVSSMDPAALIGQAEAISHAAVDTEETRFARPELESDFAPPRDDIERVLGEQWGKLLGVEGVGIRDSFFDLGGHSLIAVRLFNEIRDRFGVDLPMSVLMQSPTVERLAAIVRGREFDGETDAVAPGGPSEHALALKFRYVVPMNTGPVPGRTPFFLVAGMFGNVLNLSHIAHLLGEERPFYALQARGLYGDMEPHETFEDMAADYIEEIRRVQPHGPYLLGGFSGGGITAYEIARQLLAQGERVLTVVLLDTPVRQMPVLGLVDRLSMLVQDWRAEGASVLRKRIANRLKTKQQRLAEQRARDLQDRDAAHFQSLKIRDAFVRALARYRYPSVSVDVFVFRPKLEARYRLSGGRVLDRHRNRVFADNGWARLVAGIQVIEVPGDHDSMVLEPNVRVLVGFLNRCLAAAEHGLEVDGATPDRRIGDGTQVVIEHRRKLHQVSTGG